MFAVLLVGILQGVECPASVYSIRWWHLMLLQYVAASFKLPSISTSNINTVRYPKPYQQYEIPTIPAVVIYKLLLSQSNIIAAFVQGHRSLIWCLFTPANIKTIISHILRYIQYGHLLLTYSESCPKYQIDKIHQILFSLDASPQVGNKTIQFNI
jgi:hypothetical protein